jgi:hypothetical protein
LPFLPYLRTFWRSGWTKAQCMTGGELRLTTHCT